VYGAVVGIGPVIRYGVPNNTLVNMKRALIERQFFVEGEDGLVRVHQPVEGVYEDRLGKFRRKLLKIMPFAYPVPLVNFPGLYQARKRAIYQGAVDSLLVKPLTRIDSYLSTFLKAEKTLI
jgi:hypothetical protein